MTTFTTLKRLSISWSVSKGRDTYGYNICRLDDTQTGKRFRTCGGGYDMVGKVLAQWLAANYQDELMMIKDKAYYFVGAKGVETKDYDNSFYGMYNYINRVSIDGGCGLESVIKIINAIGYDVESVYNKRKQCTDSFIITNKESIQ